MRFCLITVLVLVLLPLGVAWGAEADSVAAPPAAMKSPDSWRFEIAPYFMAASMAGDVGAKGLSQGVTVSFSNILDNLDFGAMGYASAGKGDWTLMLDVIYMKLKKTGTLGVQGSIPTGSELEQTVVEGMISYRVPTEHDVNVYAGVRYYDLGFSLAVDDSTVLSPDQSWADPIIGLRARWDFGKKPTGWSAIFVGDVGGFGIGSEISYQIFPAAGYRFSRVVSAFLGYRYIYVDYQKSEDGFLYDMGTGGPTAGVGFTF
jgi:hypothetical protein